VSTLVHANISLKLNRGWALVSILNRTPVRGAGTTSTGYPNSSPRLLSLCFAWKTHDLFRIPWLSLEDVKPVFGPEEIVYTPVQSCESVSGSKRTREYLYTELEACVNFWKESCIVRES
jgi:hypothetical protein